MGYLLGCQSQGWDTVKSGESTRRKVEGSARLPRNFPAFLRDSKNKTELSVFLSQKIAAYEYPQGKQVIATLGPDVIASLNTEVERFVSNCDHEEADTRMILHILHALLYCGATVCVRTVDSDILAILTSMLPDMKKVNKQANISIMLGTGKSLSIRQITDSGWENSRALMAFHAWSG
eukprot:Lithocolla_globosa_v1_NODE_60_length_7376_cov_322.464554.p6 type:complete len:178 gc:universal NODE_60_length_7376_cov_322.464554:5474-6007(+)